MTNMVHCNKRWKPTQNLGLSRLRFHDIYDVYFTHSTGHLQWQLGSIMLANNTVDPFSDDIADLFCTPPGFCRLLKSLQSRMRGSWWGSCRYQDTAGQGSRKASVSVIKRVRYTPSGLLNCTMQVVWVQSLYLFEWPHNATDCIAAWVAHVASALTLFNEGTMGEKCREAII